MTRMPVIHSQRVKDIFPDSNNVSSYGCRRTKTFAISNERLAPSCKIYLAEHRKCHPFTLREVGSCSKGLEKINPKLYND